MEIRDALEKYRKNKKRKDWLLCAEKIFEEEKDPSYIKEFRKEMKKDLDNEGMRLIRESYIYLAPYYLDDYMIAMEWDRQRKFYLPRRKALLPIVEAIQRLADDELDIACISLPPGIGKALANDTPILTRNGWKNHGDLVVGDEVIGMDGKFKKVLYVKPKCMLDRLVKFTNGEQIQCHENHEWLIYDKCSGSTKLEETKYWENRKLQNDIVGRGHRHFLMIPKKEYIVGEKKILGVKPYTFGVWLGDGTNRAPRITSPKTDSKVISGIIKEGYHPKYIREDKYTGVLYYEFPGELRQDLHKFGLCYDDHRVEKYIPDEYLTASIEQRLNLLAGLLDTDGTLNGRKYIYSTTEEKLKDGVVQLISTFGWRACVKKVKPHTSSFGIVGKKDCWVISFSPDCYIPCKLERKQLKSMAKQSRIAIESITKVEPKEGNCITVEGGMYLAGKTMIPTHNTGVELFALSWMGGRNPVEGMLLSSHNNDFLKGAYEEILRELTSDDYNWNEIFPGHGVVSTNAKDMKIAVDVEQRFPTFQFTSIGAGNAGKVRALQLLCCDDLISDIQEAMSKERLDTKWQAYTVDLKQRKQGDHCKELHIATRWSVHDIIGRIERLNEGNDRALFINVPALNEQGESNFDYGGSDGFTKEFYEELRQSMDEVSFNALYMGQPIEREGLLYTWDSFESAYELPSEEPDAILAVCDTAEGGGDDTALPVFYVYGDKHYFWDCVCSSALPEITDNLCAQVLVRNKVQKCQFESNSAGGRTADKVQELVSKLGGFTHITKKRTTANKETKIIVESDWIKKNVIIKDRKIIEKGSPYEKFLNNLMSYTVAGKNKHDDCPDVMAQYSRFYRQLLGSKIEILDRRQFLF